MQTGTDLSMVYASQGYEAGQEGHFAVYENAHGDVYVEANTGFRDYPAHFFRPEVEHITMSSH
jgi:hypothetical protein